MNRTTIVWARNPDGTQGYTLNSKTGCLNHTPEGLCLGGLFPCYAFKLAHGRLRQRYLANEEIAPVFNPSNFAQNIIEEESGGRTYNENLRRAKSDPFYPRWWPERLNEPYYLGRGQFGMATISRGIFLDDMADWMGDYWPEEWTRQELQMMRDNPQHRIYTLTKQPQNLIKFSPFPPNCWVGVTATDNTMARRGAEELTRIKATIKFMSLEPLLSSISDSPFYNILQNIIDVLDWLIIGACTGRKAEMSELVRKYPELTLMPYGKRWTAQPKIEWVEEIVRAADQAGIPVFLKDNLKPLIKESRPDYLKPYYDLIRQEMPGVAGEA